MKKLMAVGLALIMCIGMMSETVFAAGPQEPVDAPTDVVLVFDPTNVDILERPTERGVSKPTSMYDLDGQNYNVDGTFDTTIYTSYYFYPNANGILYYNVTFTWERTCPTVRAAGVECWDRTTGKQVTDATFTMLENSDGTYGPTLKSGSRQISNLDPTHQYYFRYTKSFDGFDATVTGTISSSGVV